MDDKVILECVLKNAEAKEVFKAFCDDRLALSPQISPKDDIHDAIVCACKDEHAKQILVGKISKTFPDRELSFR